ncbi:MAG: DUF268 domain-containing protein [Bacteroidota bacterium]|nr:DUF268 domain-containing protein [Bacteroidota bacterium]
MNKFISFLRKQKAFFRAEADWNRKYAVYKEQLNYFRDQAGPGVEIIELACLDDNTSTTPVEPHYTYHPAWAARVLAQTKPSRHIDISSITHFSNIVSAFIPTEFYDYWPAGIVLSNYSSGKADLTNLHFESGTIESLSCMHTVEHIGLGRYGDPVDVNGDKTAMKELARVLAVNGTLLFVVPIGNPRIEFNAHRVYDYHTIISNFNTLSLKEFSLIPDDFDRTGYITNPSIELIEKQHWGCGCFWFTKL